MSNLVSSLFLTLAASAFLLVPQWTSNAAESNAVKAVASGNNNFGLELFGQLHTNPGNLFFSPYSISTCLAMTASGARGETEAQMNQVLHFGTNRAQFQSQFGSLQRQLTDVQTNGAIELSIANGLWAQKNHPFLPDFLDAVQKNFQATLKQVDFNVPEPVRKEINDWVAGQTKDKITDLIPSGALNGATRLVLANAIYFKGSWGRPFDKARTTNAPFTLMSGEKVQAQTMNRTSEFRYGEAKNLQFVELPYGDGRLSMVILLPAEGGMRLFERVLSTQSLDFWLSQMKQKKVNVFLPKFKITSQFSLAEALAEMGMKDAFSDKADFSGMDGARDLFISTVVHKAYVDVNEEGTEAAAATGAVMALKAMPASEVPVFRADHPFIFLIRDTRSGSILFLGRVLDPTK